MMLVTKNGRESDFFSRSHGLGITTVRACYLHVVTPLKYSEARDTLENSLCVLLIIKNSAVVTKSKIDLPQPRFEFFFMA